MAVEATIAVAGEAAAVVAGEAVAGRVVLVEVGAVPVWVQPADASVASSQKKTRWKRPLAPSSEAWNPRMKKSRLRKPAQL